MLFGLGRGKVEVVKPGQDRGMKKASLTPKLQSDFWNTFVPPQLTLTEKLVLGQTPCYELYQVNEIGLSHLMIMENLYLYSVFRDPLESLILKSNHLALHNILST